MEKKKGRLFHNAIIGRMDIVYEDGTIEDGLHCGTTMDVKINNKWIPTRIEMSDDWYLVGVGYMQPLAGLSVRL
jgi:hypothetical protein